MLHHLWDSGGLQTYPDCTLFHKKTVSIIIAFLSSIYLSTKVQSAWILRSTNLFSRSVEFQGFPNQRAVLDMKLALLTTLPPQVGWKLTLHGWCQNWNAPQHVWGQGLIRHRSGHAGMSLLYKSKGNQATRILRRAYENRTALMKRPQHHWDAKRMATLRDQCWKQVVLFQSEAPE